MTDINIIADPDHDPNAARKANLAKGRATAAANRKAKRAAAEAAAAKSKPAPAPKAAASDDLAGLTPLACCDACVPTRCVISGVGICAHPTKGGLQPNLQNDRSLLLFKKAKARIAGLKLKVDE